MAIGNRQKRLAWFTVVLAVTWCGGAAADVYQLKGGGQVEGLLVRRTEDGDYVIRTPDGATLAVARLDIKRIIEVDPNLAVYRDKAKQAPDTAEAHRELARWCKEHRLLDRRDHHYRRLVEIDPEDEEARLALGYRKVGGAWLTREELMKARGMRLFDGKYRT
ncbi:MAG: hypothetical protein AAF961_04295, partial [Planctomycetota bacterium]